MNQLCSLCNMKSKLSCPYCQEAFYCSSKCRDYDWIKSHALICQTDISEYEQIKLLGNGTYGKVILIKKGDQLFALKIIQKGYFLDINDVQLQREIQIHKKLIHNNIIKLNSYYQDRQSVQLVLEYAEGGSLSGKVLDEFEIVNYLRQICHGIQYLHQNNIIHRDLKVFIFENQPENILIKGDTIKLCDFGWSAEVDFTKQRDTLCGTMEYMAPEMSCGKYSFKVDMWSLGIILYELLHEELPKFPLTKFRCSTLAQDLIQRLLTTEDERLCIEDTLKHPYLQSDQIDFGKFIKMEELQLFNQLDELLQIEDVNVENKNEQIHRNTVKPRISKRVTHGQGNVILQNDSHIEKVSLLNQILQSLGCVNRQKK